MLLEELEHAGFLLRIVGGHADEIHVAAAVHAIRRFQIGELAHARRAPRRPEVDHQHFPVPFCRSFFSPSAPTISSVTVPPQWRPARLPVRRAWTETWRQPTAVVLGHGPDVRRGALDRVARVARRDGVLTRADCRSGPGIAACDPGRRRRFGVSRRPRTASPRLCLAVGEIRVLQCRCAARVFMSSSDSPTSVSLSSSRRRAFGLSGLIATTATPWFR